MINRREVEALLACLHEPNNGVIAELCRVYLAWLDAPVGTVDSCDFSSHERPAWIVIDDREAVPLNEPRRVRLVTDAEAK